MTGLYFFVEWLFLSCIFSCLPNEHLKTHQYINSKFNNTETVMTIWWRWCDDKNVDDDSDDDDLNEIMMVVLIMMLIVSKFPCIVYYQTLLNSHIYQRQLRKRISTWTSQSTDSIWWVRANERTNKQTNQQTNTPGNNLTTFCLSIGSMVKTLWSWCAILHQHASVPQISRIGWQSAVKNVTKLKLGPL